MRVKLKLRAPHRHLQNREQIYQCFQRVFIQTKPLFFSFRLVFDGDNFGCRRLLVLGTTNAVLTQNGSRSGRKFQLNGYYHDDHYCYCYYY